MANPTAPLRGDTRQRRQPTGVLRHRDLDVLLGLTHHWITQGMRDDGQVEVSLHDTLRWIGYGDSLASAPYSELHASILRLRYCRVLIYRDEDRDLVADDRSRFDYTLLADLSSERQARPGAERVMVAKLGWSMLAWMRAGSQSIDLDVYAHLVRHPLTRLIPLARVVWVALARHRQPDGSFRFRPGWLAARYGDRRNRTADHQGRLIYRDAYNSRSCLARALTALARAGVLGLRTTPDGWCEGRFGHPPGLRRLRDEPQQNRLFSIDTMAIAEAAARGEPEPQIAPALPAPAAPSPSDRRRRLLTRCRVSASVIRAATAGGWSDDQVDRLLLAALYGRHLGQVRSPAAWAASRLREDDPTAWTADAVHEAISVPNARTWAHAPGGPLSDT